MTDRELLQQAQLEMINGLTEEETNETMSVKGLSKPKKEWVGLTDEEIKQTRHHMVDGAYDYSFKQGAQWAEQMLKEKNSD
jgi:hypothetical protein